MRQNRKVNYPYQIVFKCDGELREALADVARKLGISQSAIARNVLALAIYPEPEPSELEKIIAKIKKESVNGLFKKRKYRRKKKLEQST